MKRPWSGQVEKPAEDDRPEFDPTVRKNNFQAIKTNMDRNFRSVHLPIQV